MPTFFSARSFYGGAWPTPAAAIFEVASFSHCKNIKGEFRGAPIAHNHGHFFFGVGFYDGAWQTPAACQF